MARFGREGRGGLERIAMATAVAGLLLVALKVVHRWGVWVVWDDAWIFQRYAAHVLEGHGIAWNPGEEPTYGVTALLYLVPSVVARAIFGNVAAAALVASVASGVFMLAGVAFMIASADGQRSSRLLAFALFAASFAASKGPQFFVSGMDSFFGAAYLALFIGAAHRWQARRRRSVALGILGGISLWVRPELGLFAGAVALAALLWPAEKRRAGLVLAGSTLATLGLLLLAAHLYFGTPVPLPFYAKTSGLYGPAFRQIYRGETTTALGYFLPPLWPLLSVIAFDFALGPRRYLARARPVERAVMAATLGFIAFHWFIAIPIMGMEGRLFQPAVVPLAYLATQSLARHHARARATGQGSLAWAGVIVIASVASLAPLFSQLSDEMKGLGGWLKASSRHDIYRFASAAPSDYWAKIEQLRNLDETLVIASTEVGFLGVHQHEKRIVDIAGLNDRRYAAPFDPALLLEVDAPDLIYMPHPHYVDMVEAIEEHPAFEEKYVAFSPARVGTRDFGVALRRDSPHFETLLQIYDPHGRTRKPAPKKTR